MDKDDFLIDAKLLEQFITELYKKAGMNEKEARLHAYGLIEASLRGIDSHGIIRIHAYFERAKKGAININPKMKFVGGENALGVLDADNASGYVSGDFAMKKAIDLAKKYNVGIILVKNSNHYGAASLYSQIAVDAGMVGISTTNVSPNITVPGATEDIVGNNPISIGIPTYNDFPFMLDMALSVVAGGKLKLAAKKGEKIPLGWATDKDGNPTDDPKQGFEGHLLPMGGFKGLGLAYAVDILSGVVSGGAFQTKLKSMYKDPLKPSNTCHIFAAINIDAVISKEYLKDRMLEYHRSMQKASNRFNELIFPGELEERCKVERIKKGIPVPQAVYNELISMSKYYNLTVEI